MNWMGEQWRAREEREFHLPLRSHLKKAGFVFSRRYQLPSNSSTIGDTSWSHPTLHGGDFVCLEFSEVLHILSWMLWYHLTCCIYETVSFSYPSPLALTISLPPLLLGSLSFGRRDVIYSLKLGLGIRFHSLVFSSCWPVVDLRW